jgi:hypothetical protein
MVDAAVARREIVAEILLHDGIERDGSRRAVNVGGREFGVTVQRMTALQYAAFTELL